MKIVALLVVVGALGGGLFLLWQRFGPAVLGGSSYALTVDKIEVTSQPRWIQADVTAEVFRDASWESDRLSLLDPQLTVKIAQAFETHSWVAKVKRVSKHHPARVVVDLQYRQPVAMVEVNYDGQSGLLPVDAEGVLLPPDDFSPNQARQYPRIVVADGAPAGPVGTSWGDVRVAGAARIAAAFGAKWQTLGLYRIVATVSNSVTSGVLPSYVLRNRPGTATVVWGRAPGQEASGEATASQKVARLEKYMRENGGLPRHNSTIEIDIRVSGIGAAPLLHLK